MSQYFKHETAIVDDGAVVGENAKIWHWTHVSSKAVIGEKCSLGQNVYIGNNVTIGANCKIQNNVSVYDNVFLESDVFCGPSMVFTNVYNPRSAIIRKDEYRTTMVRKGTTIGANATIVCGVELGEYSFIAAGAVITKNVKPFALMAGVPARQIGWMSMYGERIKLPLEGNGEFYCPNSDVKYQLVDGQLSVGAPI